MSKQKQFFLLVLFGIIIYISYDCYTLNGSVQILHMLSMINTHCRNRNYPNTHYRHQFMDGNDTYSVYCIQIGKIYSTTASSTEIEDLSAQIAQDLLWYKHKIHQNNKYSIQRKQLYDTYFKDFYVNKAIECPQQNQFDTIDFFDFIHFGGKRTNDPNQTPINWYKLLPVNDVLNDTYYTAKARHIGDHIHDEYYVPALYTYVLSVDKSGYLPSVQLRFGEIVNEMQHDEMKHLMLNNNERHILWAGEFYYIYDYKWRKYVLLFDNASGHWKPNANHIPHYLQHILVKTLFPYYNVSILDEDDDPYEYKNYYRPLILLGYHDHPWHQLKSILFPVVDDIKDLYKTRKVEKIREFKKLFFNKFATKKQAAKIPKRHN